MIRMKETIKRESRPIRPSAKKRRRQYKQVVFVVVLLAVVLVGILIAIFVQKAKASKNVVEFEMPDIGKAYAEYHIPAGAETDWRLQLVNDNCPLDRSLSWNLCSVEGEDLFFLRPEAAESYVKMRTAAAEDGILLFIRDGYLNETDESLRYQEELEKGADLQNTCFGIPGCGEHGTALAIDIITDEEKLAFEQTEAFGWLLKNAKAYGFILRYPAEKSVLTGHAFNANHFRYIGKENAEQFDGLCLEEILALVQDQQ